MDGNLVQFSNRFGRYSHHVAFQIIRAMAKNNDQAHLQKVQEIVEVDVEVAQEVFDVFRRRNINLKGMQRILRNMVESIDVYHEMKASMRTKRSPKKK